MTSIDSHTQFALYVVRHTDFALGDHLAKRLQHHWSTDPYRQIVGGDGINVLPAHARVPSAMPPIDWDASSATAVVVLVDRLLAVQPSWLDYVRELVAEADARGFAGRVFPVGMEPDVWDALDGRLRTQAHRWDAPAASDSDRERRLISDLLHQFCRMLQYQLSPKSGEPATLSGYLSHKVRIFISHSKHDGDGEVTARSIHEWVRDNSDLDTFFDVVSIPIGISSEDVIYNAIPNCAMVICYSDSYSSRQWCRREVVAAKRHGIPLIIVDCLRDMDPRLFPYLGNVPVLRVDPHQGPRTEQIVVMVLDEVFRDLLWRCRVASLDQESAGTAFTSRKPELCLLAALSRSSRKPPVVVYPGPPIGAEEQGLFADISPEVQLRTFDDWTRRRA